jgi:hypothetical protein
MVDVLEAALRFPDLRLHRLSLFTFDDRDVTLYFFGTNVHHATFFVPTLGLSVFSQFSFRPRACAL